MSINLDLVRKKLENLQANSNKNVRIWKPKPGRNTVRIVPYKFDKDNPFIELYFHYNLGRKNLLSLETFGEADPIVEFSKSLQETGNKEDWKLGKKLEPKLRTFVPIIVRGEEAEGVRFWGFGKQIYQELLSIVSDPDYGDISDLMNGRDIQVDFKTPKEAGNTYGEVSMRMKPNQCPATTDKSVADLIVNDQVDIYTVYKRTDYSELKTILEKWLDPDNQEAQNAKQSTSDADIDSIEEPEEFPVTKKEVAKKEVDKPSTKATTKTDLSDISNAFDNLFNDKK